MNIISQNFENVLKNRMKDKVGNITDNFIKDLLRSMSYPQDASNNYVNIISKANDVSINIVKEVMLDVIKEFDDYFRNSIERKRNYYINKKNLSRTIVTIIGEITFERTYYVTKDKSDKKYYAFIDELLNLPQYDHYDPIVKGLAIRESFYTNQAQAGRIVGERICNIKNMTDRNTSVYSISRQNVNKWIKDWNINITYDKQEKTPKTLYIMVDEKYIGSQDLDNDIMSKCFVVFEGIKTVSKGRRALINRHIFTCHSNKPWEEFLDRLCEIYNYDEIENFYVLSDGGNWITAGIRELKVESFQKVQHLLCLFHFKQAINHITTIKEERTEIFSSFLNDKYNIFQNKLSQYIIKYPHKKDTIEKKIKYLLSHYSAAKHMVSNNFGSSMESHISHFVASVFSSRPKGYSSLNINKYLMLNDAKNNGINLFNSYLQTYNLDDKVISYNENSNNISELKKEILSPVILPIISSDMSPLQQTIKGLSRISSEINC